jgi:hypothetical protein
MSAERDATAGRETLWRSSRFYDEHYRRMPFL